MNKISPNEKIYLRVAHEAFCYCVNILNEKKTESGQSTINKEGNSPKPGFSYSAIKSRLERLNYEPKKLSNESIESEIERLRPELKSEKFELVRLAYEAI